MKIYDLTVSLNKRTSTKTLSGMLYVNGQSTLHVQLLKIHVKSSEVS